jgi:predicted dehydrogenase
MKTSKKQVRYAVIGLGHIAQVAVLPAFAQCEKFQAGGAGFWRSKKGTEAVAQVSSARSSLR